MNILREGRSPARRLRRFAPDIILALLVAVCCLAVYNATLTPSLSYRSPDGNELATVCYTLGLAHATGYPLYTWLGKLFTLLPVGDVAHRVNLMSAVLGAAGVGLLFAVLRRLTGNARPLLSRSASIFGALLYGFSVTFWSQAVIAEVYAPNLFMAVLSVLALLQWAHLHQASAGTRGRIWFWTFALAYGLSLGTHLSNLGFAPAFAVFVVLIDPQLIRRPRIWIIGACLFALGLLQFLWLPYKASTLNDQVMLRTAPTTWKGAFDYTLGAFPQLKFAFPLAAIPERIVLYLSLLSRNFSTLGVVAGLFGMGALLFRHPRRFYLLIGMLLVHVWFFVQYRAFDLDVFFIPAHFVLALFIGYAAYAALSGLRSLADAGHPRRVAIATTLTTLLALMLAASLAAELAINWGENDRSSDTAINDFYENVFELLPQESALLGRSGVLGFDMFYFRLVYDYRPDVLIPMLNTTRPLRRDIAGRAIYTTDASVARGAGGPWSPPQGLISADAWTIPVLLGQSGGSSLRNQGQPLWLLRVQVRPPELVVPAAQPEVRTDQQLDGLLLLGFDLDQSMAFPGGRLHITLYWRVIESAGGLVATSLADEFPLENHEFGLGNLARYRQEVGPLRSGVVVEDYWVVIPAFVSPGEYPLHLRLESSLPAWASAAHEPADAIILQTVTVQDRPSR